MWRKPSSPTVEPPAGTTETQVVVTLVHGTFARGTGWTQDGSTLRRAISNALMADAEAAPPDITFDVFEWSGRNTHKARTKAGHQLADHIRQLRKRNPHCRHFIVSHSHGGNIALFAHKHLPEDMHALGIATLGTPFVFARPEKHMAGKSLDDLLNEAPKHTDNLAGGFAWVVGLPVALTAENWLPSLGFTEFYWEILSGIIAGLLAAQIFRIVFPPIARFGHRFGAKRSAAKLAQAIAFPEVPRTHLLSFTYPGDEAQRLLDALEATTSLPQRGIRFINAISEPGLGMLFLGLIAAGILSAIVQSFIDFDGEALADGVASVFTAVIMTVIISWMLLVTVRFILSFVRGHPWGFGWERPSLHAHVAIGVEPKADVPVSKSHIHETVPLTDKAVPGGGMRHVGLYEDQRILKALGHWMANVR
ncbi:MAG: hypothetical protein RIC14_00825 [Filomicrobium sp.]